MVSETGTVLEPETESPNRLWVDAGASGLVAGLLMGLVMQFGMDVMPIVGGLYGVESAPAGWVAHLFHAVLFALAFAALASAEEVSAYSRSPGTAAVLGVAWATVLWLVAASVVMPLWVGAVQPLDPPVPQVKLLAGAAHLVYGVVLGGTFGYLRGR